MIAPIANVTIPPSSGSSGSSTTASSNSNATVDQNMFLQLLVAQLQNQDPTQPMDSTTFVTQLAQFQQLQQSSTTGQDVTAIRQDLDQLVAATTSSTATNS
jgi:flagellar basal-body rod modification protein FlgD